MTDGHNHRSAASTHTLPCVVQLGFAGSRSLVEDPTANAQQAAAVQAAVEQYLTELLARLPLDLKLDANHFLVGISQIACGADTAFTRACRTQKIPQRIFLPQHRENYLSATGTDGVADFTPDERAEAESLMRAEHIIQERVVSQSRDRSIRFQQTNVEILRVSDVVVCLLRENAASKPGGTNQLLERAKARGTAVLEIRVGLKDGQTVFREQWHNIDADHPFHSPKLPHELARLPLATENMPPSRDEYCQPLKDLASNQADLHQGRFKFAARNIIGTHTLATICATVAVAFHGCGQPHEKPHDEHVQAVERVKEQAKTDRAAERGKTESAEQQEKAETKEEVSWSFAALLLVEVVLLGIGLKVHRRLHHSRAARVWAVSRVVAELARSMDAIGDRHLYLEYLYRLPLPYHFRQLLRTLNVLHLRSTWQHRNDDWNPIRAKYIYHRFDDPIDGQVLFYETRLNHDQRWLNGLQQAFTCCSVLAIVATVTKLSLLFQHTWLHDEWYEIGKGLLGLLAIVLPVVAVGCLSWAAAMDYEARVETFGETLSFLRRQKPLLKQADSAGEFDFLLMETETVLLGEIANWFSRRSTTGVN